MRNEVKVMVSGLLTYMVFGLFNRFGQPQTFLPLVGAEMLILPITLLAAIWKKKEGMSFLIFCALLLPSFMNLLLFLLPEDQIEWLPVSALISYIFAHFLYTAELLKNFKKGNSIQRWLKISIPVFMLGWLILLSLFPEKQGYTIYQLLYWAEGILAIVLVFFPSGRSTALTPAQQVFLSAVAVAHGFDLLDSFFVQ